MSGGMDGRDEVGGASESDESTSGGDVSGAAVGESERDEEGDSVARTEKRDDSGGWGEEQCLALLLVSDSVPWLGGR